MPEHREFTGEGLIPPKLEEEANVHETSEQETCPECAYNFPVVRDDGNNLYIARHQAKEARRVRGLKRQRQIRGPDIVTEDSHVVTEYVSCPGGGRFLRKADNKTHEVAPDRNA